MKPEASPKALIIYARGKRLNVNGVRSRCPSLLTQSDSVTVAEYIHKNIVILKHLYCILKCLSLFIGGKKINTASMNSTFIRLMMDDCISLVRISKYDVLTPGDLTLTLSVRSLSLNVFLYYLA